MLSLWAGRATCRLRSIDATPSIALNPYNGHTQEARIESLGHLNLVVRCRGKCPTGPCVPHRFSGREWQGFDGEWGAICAARIAASLNETLKPWMNTNAMRSPTSHSDKACLADVQNSAARRIERFFIVRRSSDQVVNLFHQEDPTEPNLCDLGRRPDRFRSEQNYRGRRRSLWIDRSGREGGDPSRTKRGRVWGSQAHPAGLAPQPFLPRRDSLASSPRRAYPARPVALRSGHDRGW